MAMVEKPSVTEISTTSIKLTTVFTIGESCGIIEKGFCWSEIYEWPGTADNSIQIVDDNMDTIEGEITGLASKTQYHIRAYVINNAGTGYSEAITITTNEQGEIIVGSTGISEITSYSALAVSSVINTTKRKINTFRFLYIPENHDPEAEPFIIEAEGTEEEFTTILHGLRSDTEYTIRSYVEFEGDTIFGEITTFRTEISNEDIISNFASPAYADDYSGIAGWGQRSLWNLANVHDPTIEKCGDYYYMYSTDASYGNAHNNGQGHFLYRRSADLVNWEFMGMAMTQTPAWVKDTLNNMRSRLDLPPIDNPNYGYWAPVVRKAGNKYRMYYSIVIDNYIKTGKTNTTANFDNSWTERAFIGLMETDDLGNNQWEDKGMVVCSSTDRGTNWSRSSQSDWNGYFKWNAIDPSFIITPEGEHWLIYGSWHSGIVALQLNPETGKPDELGDPWNADALENYGTRIYTRSPGSRWQGSEAPEIIYNQETGYYYLFLAYDELSVAYNTRVCRSKNINGPYSGYNGRNISTGEVFPIITHPYKFKNHSGWVGISHNCIFKDDEGNWYYSSQGRLPENTNGNRYSNAVMMGHVRKIRWTSDGWPVVMPERYAGVPDLRIDESELIGSWEYITLTYSYGKQQSSSMLTLRENYTTTGAVSGRWSYDSEKKELKINNMIYLVEREVDWEADPRKPTIIFAGLNTAGVSLWGKKVD